VKIRSRGTGGDVRIRSFYKLAGEQNKKKSVGSRLGDQLLMQRPRKKGRARDRKFSKKGSNGTK